MKKRVVEEKKEGIFSKRKIGLYLIGFFLISIMVLSVFDVGGGNKSESYKYNDIKFTEVEGGWIGYLEEKPIILMNSPEEVQDINVDGNGFSQLGVLGKVYVSVNPEDYLAISFSQVSRNLEFSGAIITACYDDFEGCEELPIKTCEDADARTGVIMFKSGETNTIKFKNNCLELEAEEDMSKVVDRLILEWNEI